MLITAKQEKEKPMHSFKTDKDTAISVLSPMHWFPSSSAIGKLFARPLIIIARLIGGPPALLLARRIDRVGRARLDRVRPRIDGIGSRSKKTLDGTLRLKIARIFSKAGFCVADLFPTRQWKVINALSKRIGQDGIVGVFDEFDFVRVAVDGDDGAVEKVAASIKQKPVQVVRADTLTNDDWQADGSYWTEYVKAHGIIQE